jgi:lipopolysaccharide/colanic/teichoic acid biosynthesis glycosyltransferase
VKIKSSIIFLGDILLLFLSLLFILWQKPGSSLGILESYKESLLCFGGIWVLVSIVSSKYKAPKQKKGFLISTFRILITSGIVLGIITSLMFLFRVDYYSRFVVFGTLLTLTICELIITSVYYAFKNASLGEPDKTFKSKRAQHLPIKEIISHQLVDEEHHLSKLAIKNRRDTILTSVGEEGLTFIEKYAHIELSTSLFASTISSKSIQLLPSNFQIIVNLERINNFRYINKFFEEVNHHLPKSGIYINFFESKNQRKKRILKKFPPVLNYIFYFFDFIVKRVFPKFALTKKIYFLLTRGNNRVLTRAEAFGRLYSCGFKLIEELETDQYVLFAAIKVKKPLYPEQPSYGPLIKLKRIGKNGKIINVYKLRTMHPYSEFIQEYVYQKEGLNEGGKFKSDFRVSTIGRIFRTFWLDELPMLLNLLNRDIKIVGVRPISKHYFDLYTEEHRKRRLKYTPGLIPPFYVDNPKTLEEIMLSEKKYFDAFDKHPIITDSKYFFKALYNIVFKKARSA